MSDLSEPRRIIVHDGVALAVRECGEPDGRPIVLLHGFPETGATWGPLARFLLSDGWRVVAPDLRGFGMSDAPRRVRRYRLDLLVDDVAAVIKDLGGPVDVVGHDWGGALVWLVAERFPHLAASATVLSAPHPFELRSTMRRDRTQRARSRYILMAQLPMLPERRLARDHHSSLVALLASSHTPDEIADYRVCWGRDGVVRGMVNWYRALVRAPGPDRSAVAGQRPVLLVTGADDPLFGPNVLERSVSRNAGSRCVVLDGIGHAPHRQAPELVADVLRKLQPGGERFGGGGAGLDAIPSS